MQSSYHCTCRCVKQRAYRRCLPQTRAYCRCLLQATGGRGCARDSADLWGRVLWSWSSAKITRGISLQTYSSSSWELSIWVHMCSSGPHLYTVYLHDYISSSSVWPSKKSGLILKWPKIGGRNPVKKSRPVMRGPNIGSTHYWSWFGARNVGIILFAPRMWSWFGARNVGIILFAPRSCVTGSGCDGVCVCVCVCVQCVCVLIVHSVAIDTVGSRPFSDDWHAQCVWQSPVWQSGCMQ